MAKHEIEEPVLIEYNQFTLLPFRSWPQKDLQLPKGLMWAGDGGALFRSGGTDHYAGVRVVVCPHEPPPDTTQPWELVEQGVFTCDDPQLVLVGATGRISDARIELPAPGRYGIRAHCRGREAAQKVNVGDGRGFPRGLESWLLQIWPVSGITSAAAGADSCAGS